MGSTLTNVGTFFVIVGMLLSGLLMVTSFSESRANGGWKTVGGARRRVLSQLPLFLIFIAEFLKLTVGPGLFAVIADVAIIIFGLIEIGALLTQKVERDYQNDVQVVRTLEKLKAGYIIFTFTVIMVFLTISMS